MLNSSIEKEKLEKQKSETTIISQISRNEAEVARDTPEDLDEICGKTLEKIQDIVQA